MEDMFNGSLVFRGTTSLDFTKDEVILTPIARNGGLVSVGTVAIRSISIMVGQ